MLSTRLIFVDGIMGSGKTTTGTFLTEYLQNKQIATRFLAEGPTLQQPTHPLRVATEFLHPHAPWCDLTIDQFIERSLSKWHSFAEPAFTATEITVCDGLLFHGNLTDLFMMSAEPTSLLRYVSDVIDITSRLNPAVIYFYHSDIAAALQTIGQERGAAWQAYQVNWKVASPCAIQRSLQGFDGLIQLYRDYCSITNDVFENLTVPKIRIHHESDWATKYREILAFLQL